MDDFLKQFENENTRSAYGRAVSLWWEYIRGRELTDETAGGFCRWLQGRGLKAASQRLYLNGVVLYLEWLGRAAASVEVDLARFKSILVLRDRISVLNGQPHARTELPKTDDMARALAWMDGEPPGPNLADKLRWFRDRALFKLLLGTGLRPSEACRARTGDLKGRRLRVTVKGGGSSEVMLPPQTVEAIKGYLRLRWELDQRQDAKWQELPLLARHDKRASKKVLPISVRTAENVVSGIGQEAGLVVHLTPYVLRHYAAENMLEKSGGDAFMVRHALNHRNMASTERYVDYPRKRAMTRVGELGDELLRPLGTPVPNASDNLRSHKKH